MRNTLKQRFQIQKSKAAKRDIDFLLTYEEWLSIWEQSGKLDQRGRGRGKYCMARHGDQGPYAIGNVSIKTHEDNIIEKNLGKPNPKSPETRAKISKTLTGKKQTVQSNEKRRIKLVGKKRPPEVIKKINETKFRKIWEPLYIL